MKFNSEAEDKEIVFPYSLWYKSNAIGSLEIAQSINTVVFCAFWIRFFTQGWIVYADAYNYTGDSIDPRFVWLYFLGR